MKIKAKLILVSSLCFASLIGVGLASFAITYYDTNKGFDVDPNISDLDLNYFILDSAPETTSLEISENGFVSNSIVPISKSTGVYKITLKLNESKVNLTNNTYSFNVILGYSSDTKIADSSFNPLTYITKLTTTLGYNQTFVESKDSTSFQTSGSGTGYLLSSSFNFSISSDFIDASLSFIYTFEYNGSNFKSDFYDKWFATGNKINFSINAKIA